MKREGKDEYFSMLPTHGLLVMRCNVPDGIMEKNNNVKKSYKRDQNDDVGDDVDETLEIDLSASGGWDGPIKHTFNFINITFTIKF